MPIESRLFVKTALVALVVAFSWGAWMALEEAFGRSVNPIWAIEHAHVAFVGWLVNMVIGFALWLLPLNRERFPDTQGRYFRWMPLTIYLLLNGGLIARIFSEPAVAVSAVARLALGASAVAQVGAILLFVALAWLRTRPPSRPAKGVR
ncbi:MAG TPA: hypothetical protein VNG31_09770 [Candidatus Baltobacteraceae bacterium]|nr:hypothetical protein [Candidatus Baltobacteraceae bacterium]